MIGGSSGRADGKKAMRLIVDSIICPKLMSNITWTGKTAKNMPKKIKFESYTNIIRVILDLSISADRSFTEQSALHELKYSVIKYAHSRTQTAIATPSIILTTTSTTPIEISQSQPQPPPQQPPQYPQQPPQYPHQQYTGQPYFHPQNYYSNTWPNEYCWASNPNPNPIPNSHPNPNPSPSPDQIVLTNL